MEIDLSILGSFLSVALNIALIIAIFRTYNNQKELNEKITKISYDLEYLKNKIRKNFPE